MTTLSSRVALADCITIALILALVVWGIVVSTELPGGSAGHRLLSLQVPATLGQSLSLSLSKPRFEAERSIPAVLEDDSDERVQAESDVYFHLVSAAPIVAWQVFLKPVRLPLAQLVSAPSPDHLIERPGTPPPGQV